MRNIALVFTASVLLAFTAGLAQDSSKSRLPQIKVPAPKLDTDAVARLTSKIEATDGGVQLGELYDDLASEYGRSGKWKEAADRFRHAAEADPEQSRYWMRCAVSLLLADDQKAYKTWVEKMIKQFEGSDDYCAVERVAKMCTLSKTAIGKQEEIIKLAAESLRDSQGSSWAEYFPSTQGIVLYRFGKYHEALKALELSDQINAKAGSEDVTAINLAVRALCQIKQGKRAEAREILNSLQSKIQKTLADTELVRTPGYWHDWMFAKILYEEAIELLKMPIRNPS